MLANQEDSSSKDDGHEDEDYSMDVLLYNIGQEQE